MSNIEVVTIGTEENSGDSYQINVVNIKYTITTETRRMKERPDMATLDVPEALLKLKDRDYEKFLDSVESFAYNTLSRKYGAEVSHCQVYLPLDD